VVVLVLLVSSQVAYEGFLGDPVGGGIKYSFYYDSLSLSFRGGVGIGGFLSYLNLPVMGDVVLNVPVREGVAVYMGGGVLTGFRLFGGFDAGIGVRIILGAEFTATDKLGLGFEFDPLVVKSFFGKAHPGVSFGIRVAYYPDRSPEGREKVTLTETGNDVEGENGEDTQKGRKHISGGDRKNLQTQPSKPQKGTTSQQTIDEAAADREYKLGLQAYASGDLEKAKLHFQAALRYNPNHEKARMALDKVKRQLGER